MGTVKKILTLKQCPHCKGTGGYYQKVKSKGTWFDNTTWEGEKENTEMMDSFEDTWEAKHYKCRDCLKIICRVDDEIKTID